MVLFVVNLFTVMVEDKFSLTFMVTYFLQFSQNAISCINFST